MFNFTARPKRVNRTEQVNTLVDADLKQHLQAAASELGTTVAAIAYEALQAWQTEYNKAAYAGEIVPKGETK